MPYYKVTGAKLALQIEQHQKDLAKVRRAAKKWAKSFGGIGILTGGLQSWRVTGIVSDDCPGPEWCHSDPKSSKHHNAKWWRPRRTKAGLTVGKAMGEFKIPCVQDLQKVVGYDPPFFCHMGCQWIKSKRLLIFQTHKGQKYEPPRGVKRITDVEYEKLTA